MVFDPFHIMPSLNRTIGKDLVHYRNEKFVKEKNEFLSLRKMISKIQKQLKNCHHIGDPIIDELRKDCCSSVK